MARPFNFFTYLILFNLVLSMQKKKEGKKGNEGKMVKKRLKSKKRYKQSKLIVNKALVALSDYEISIVLLLPAPDRYIYRFYLNH